MSDKPEVTVVVGGLLDASFGQVFDSVEQRVKSLQQTAAEAGVLRERITQLQTLNSQWLTLKASQDRSADTLQVALRAQRDALQGAGVDVSDLGAAWKQVDTLVRGAQSKVGGWQRISEGAGQLGAVGKVWGSVKAPLKQADDFEQQVQTLALRGGAMDESGQKALGAQVLDAAQRSDLSRDDVLALVSQMLDKQLTLAEVKAALPGAARLSRGYAVTPEQIAGLVGNWHGGGNLVSSAAANQALVGEVFQAQSAGMSLDAWLRGGKAASSAAGGYPGNTAMMTPLPADGVLDQAVDMRRGTAAGQRHQALGAVDSALFNAGEALLPVANEFAPIVKTLADTASQLIEAYPKQIAKGLELLAAYKAAVGTYNLARGALDVLRGGGGKGGQAGKGLGGLGIQPVFVTNWPGQGFELPGGEGGKRGDSKRKPNRRNSRRGGSGGSNSRLGQVFGAIGERLRSLLGSVKKLPFMEGLGNLGKGFARKVPLLGTLLTGLDLFDVYSSNASSREKAAGYGGALGSLGGMLAGGEAGAALGTLVFPGIGTFIGGAIGAVLGGLGGGAIGAKAGELLHDGVDKLSVPQASVGAAAAATLGTLIPGVTPMLPLFGNRALDDWNPLHLGERLARRWMGSAADVPADDTPPLANDPAGAGVATSALPVSPANWNFAPQITLNVGGGLFEPRQVAEQLLPQLRQLLTDFQVSQRSESLFDHPVV